MKENNQAKKLPGFYIALCCCVIAIGVAGFIVQNNETRSTSTPTTAEETSEPYYEADASVQEDTDIYPETDSVMSEEKVLDDGENTAVEDLPSTDVDYTYDNPDIATTSVTVNAQQESSFCSPLAEMTLLYGFKTDSLVYNETYKDWRTHNGLDLAAPIGCSVCAIEKGTVLNVEDGSYGKTVTIEHENGFKSVYAQLGEVNVNIGDTIEQGAVIGTIGECVGENIKDSHLHFEIHKNDVPVNPEEY